MKKIFKVLKLILVLAIVGLLFQQIITLVLPEGRKTKKDDEVYQMEIREDWSPMDSDWFHLKYDKINKGPYDVQYSPSIVDAYDDTAATVMGYEAYCEICKELEISQTYTNMNADYIVWKAKGSPKVRWDVVNVVVRDKLAVIYLKKTVNFLRNKNMSGRIIIIPIEKGIIEFAGVGDAYKFDFGRRTQDSHLY